MRAFIHYKGNEKAEWKNIEKILKAVPRVGEYITEPEEGDLFRVYMVLYPFHDNPDFDVEIFSVKAENEGHVIGTLKPINF